jgi:plasmid stabilization system protein ParE
MSRAVWTLGAEADVQAIYERLESWEEGTGDSFYAEVLASIELLEAFPEIGPVVHLGKIRRVLVFNRNYGLFYVPEARGVVLHALLDLRQDDRAIAKRIAKI